MRLLALLICFYSQAVYSAWEFKEYVDGDELSSNTMIMPFIYSNAVCRFDFVYYDGTSYQSSDINVPFCDQSYVVLDNYIYQLPVSFQFFMQNEEWIIYDNIQMGSCVSESNGFIPTSYPRLQIGPNKFKLDGTVANTIKNKNNSLYFFFTSVNGDVKCSNGIRYEHDGDLIFRGVFE